MSEQVAIETHIVRKFQFTLCLQPVCVCRYFNYFLFLPYSHVLLPFNSILGAGVGTLGTDIYSTSTNGGQPNFYYGAPVSYAESIAPSHHSTYAHYYDDDEDGWEMPNFYNETYMKESLHNNKNGNTANTLPGINNPSICGNKEELYDRLRRHQYNGKKGSK